LSRVPESSFIRAKAKVYSTIYAPQPATFRRLVSSSIAILSQQQSTMHPTSLVSFFSSHSSLHNFQLDRTTHISPRTRIGGRQPFIIIWASSDLATVPYRRTIPQYCNCAFHFPFPFPVFTALLQISQHSFIPSTLYRIVHFITACYLLPRHPFFLPSPFSIRYSHSMPTASKVCMGCDMGTFDLFFFSVSFY